MMCPKDSDKKSHGQDEKTDIEEIFYIFVAAGFLMAAAILTQFSQEDAFIYFRTAQNIAIAGDYSFNLGEGYPAATSFLYAYTLGIFFYLFGDFSLFVINVFNCMLCMHAAYFLSKIAALVSSSSYKVRNISFWVVATSSPMITLATSGMETALLLWALCLLLYSVSHNRVFLILFSAALVPLVRLEAGIVPILATMVLIISRRPFGASASLVGVVFGVALFIFGNYVLTGEFVPQTITAKNESHQPSRDLFTVLSRTASIFFNSNFLIGLNTKYMPSFIPLIVGVAFVVSSLFFLYKSFYRLLYSSKDLFTSWMIPSLIVLVIYAFFVGYSIGGVIFPWYLWPSSVLFYFIISIALASFRHKLWARLVVVFLSILSYGNLVVLSNTGYKEVSYRSEIGREISRRAELRDTLFLEPAGYIPFYAGIWTWDTVGLVSPDIRAFRHPENPDWWIDFVKEKRPTWIVERSPIHASGFPDATSELGFSSNDRDFFNVNYELVLHYVYDDFRDANAGPLMGIYSLGSHSDYYLYRLRSDLSPS